MRGYEGELRRFVIDNFLYGREQRFSDEDSLMELGFLDSTGLLELVSFLEKKYGIVVEDADLIPENLDSIGNLARFVHRKLGQTVHLVPAMEPALHD
jgi:acyl carrier protein